MNMPFQVNGIHSSQAPVGTRAIQPYVFSTQIYPYQVPGTQHPIGSQRLSQGSQDVFYKPFSLNGNNEHLPLWFNNGTNRTRWANTQIPLRIYIQADTSKESTAELIMSIAQEWEIASRYEEFQIVINTFQQIGLQFQRVYHYQKPGDADILIHWEQDTVLGRDFETGHTNRTVSPQGWITEAHITLIEEPRIYAHLSKTQQEQCLRATILHELGHALGLEHSQSQKDVMYYRGWQNTNLTQGDIKALQSLYPPHPSYIG